jgi:energy-coupling factor transporter ATP-binding protein EcfA2
VTVVEAGRPEVLLVGGRSGAGKTTVAYAVSALLRERGVAHCHVEGDNLSAAYPKPDSDPRGSLLTEANLSALWRNYAALGYGRLVYVNTVSVLESTMVVRALGGAARVVGVLLTAEDGEVERRLGTRERGPELAAHLERSRRAADMLSEQSPAGTHVVPTDARTPEAVAEQVVRLSGWARPPG